MLSPGSVLVESVRRRVCAQRFPAGRTLNPGDILVANFNAGSNLQGSGTTIVRIDEDGQQSLFFQGQTGLRLTTPLGVLRSGTPRWAVGFDYS